MAKVVDSLVMARRPEMGEEKVWTREELKEIAHNLALLSVQGVREFYERAYRECVQTRKVAQCVDALLTISPASEADACRSAFAALTTLARRAFGDTSHELYARPRADVSFVA